MILLLGKEPYKYQKPTQEPINPPYKESVDLRRQQKLQKPETSELEPKKEEKSVEEKFIDEFVGFQISEQLTES